TPSAPALDPSVSPTILGRVSAETLERLSLAERVIPPADAGAAQDMVQTAVEGGAAVSVAMVGATVVALALSHPGEASNGRQHDLLAVGVAPEMRRKGVARELLRHHVESLDGSMRATVSVAERDPIEPLPV